MDLSVYNKNNNITCRPNGLYQSQLTQDVDSQLRVLQLNIFKESAVATKVRIPL